MHRCLSFLVCCIFIFSVLSIIIIKDIKNKQIIELERFKENTSITGIVTDSQGKNKDKLGLLSSYVEILMGEKNKEMAGIISEIRTYADFSLINPLNYRLRRITNVNSDILLKNKEIIFENGYSQNIFGTKERVCIVPESLNYKLGETIEIKTDFSINGTDVFLFKIVGIIKNFEEKIIYCPFLSPWIGEEAFVFSVDFLEFTISDAKELDAIKNTLFSSQYFVKPKLSNQTGGIEYGIRINDQFYLLAIKKLEENITYLNTMYHFMLIILVFVTTFYPAIFVFIRKKAIFIMRSLGLSKKTIIKALFYEQSIILICGFSFIIIIAYFLKLLSFEIIFVCILMYMFMQIGLLILAIYLVNRNVIECSKEA